MADELDLYEREIILQELSKILECSNMDEAQFRCRARDLMTVQRKFLKVQNKIEKTLLKNNMFQKDEQLKIRNDFDELYYTMQVKYEKLKKIDEENKRLSRISLNNPLKSQSDMFNSHFKLPTLPLPTFSGEQTDWPSFYDLFSSLVHHNSAYSNAEKFRYLLLSLKHEPYNLIKSIPITDANYETALNTLVSRYDNKRIIASKHLDNIFDIEHCDKQGLPNKGLRNLLNIFQENIKALEMMNFPIQQWSFILLHILLRKIPSSTRHRFELSLAIPSDIPQVDSLIKFLEKELTANEMANIDNFSSKYNKRIDKDRDFSNRFPSSRYSNETAISNQNHSKAPCFSQIDKTQSCICCNSDFHALTKCMKFLNLSPNDRFKIIQNKNICYNCLLFGHNSEQCKSTFTCRFCNRRHHSFLHFENTNLISAAIETHNDCDRSTSFPMREKCEVNPNSIYCEKNPSSVNETVEIKHSLISSVKPLNPYGSCTPSTARTQTVLLPTALIDICVNPQNKQTIRCLIDSGSQASFITESCVKNLGLAHQKINVPILGLGCDNPVHIENAATCNITPVNQNHPPIPVQALILPKLATQMPSVPLSHTEWPHIKNLKLADPNFFYPQSIDMILGADIISDIMLGDIVSGPPGTPIAMNSIFGYLLSGKVNLNFPILTPLVACFGSSCGDIDFQEFQEPLPTPTQPPFIPNKSHSHFYKQRAYFHGERQKHVHN